ncbi:Heavy-metal-associated domain-containing protein [Musa troglodytarum]|uniref:Heavy-metal-associated domain-containing protein n=2 Tax=Musa troglodytarum TaxID=320322 RepID=A0A9E7EDU7_9LILI|nr:Heavy-metal-associated domain-containing protein [Musa troglodytarum]
MAKKKNKGGENGEAAVGNPAGEAGRGGEGGNEEKDAGGNITVVLKVDMHCEGCAKKVIKSVKGVQGVEGVKADAGSGKLTVMGKLDPWKLRDRVEAKTHKKVDLVSPANFPKKGADANDPSSSSAKKPAAVKKPDDKKPQDKLAVTTVVLKIRLHCEGCIRRIRKTITKIKGVDSVVFDTQKDLVTVKGTMDAKPLPEVLKAKLKRDVEVVQPKKDGGEKKDKGGGGEKKEKGGGVGGGGGGGGGGGEKETNAKAATVPEPPNEMDYYARYGYRFQMVHAPQLFSDENPNSCSVM